MRRLILALILLPFFATGCATNGSSNLGSLSDLAPDALVILTMKQIEKADDRPAKAAEYRAKVQRFMPLVSGESVRTALLSQILNELVAENAGDPSDTYLLARAGARLDVFVGDDEYIDGPRLERLRVFLGDLEAVTYLYGESQ